MLLAFEISLALWGKMLCAAVQAVQHASSAFPLVTANVASGHVRFVPTTD
jgi:hypothetical protein